MDIEDKKSVVGLCTFVGGLIIAVLSIYWLYYVYKIQFDVHRIYLAQLYCGSDVMEKDTLRYQIKQGALNEVFSTFQRTVTALTIIGLIVTGVGFLGLYRIASEGGFVEMNTYFQLTMFVVIFLLFLFVIRTYNSTIADSVYETAWTNAQTSLNTILTKSYTNSNSNQQNSVPEYFIKNKLATFSPQFVKELVQRVRNERYVHANKDPSVEMVYTDSGLVTELEDLIFPQEGTIITVKTEKLLELLRPEKNIDPTTNLRKRDLEYIDEAYRDWACVNSTNPGITCSTESYVTHLPELASNNRYPALQGMLTKYMIFGWFLFTLMMYTFYHQYYARDLFIQSMVLLTVIILLTITMYYLMAVRYDL